MTILSTLMTDDHRACDHDFAGVETLVNKGDWRGAEAQMARFGHALQAHFRTEEELLFPRFEAVTGMLAGPTAVMRGEHVEMRAFLQRMIAAIEARDPDEFAGEAETLLIMIQQHNMKEENILYPMCDARLAAEAASLAADLDASLRAGATTGAEA